MPNAFVGALTTLIGVSLLFGSWDGRIPRRFWPVAVGWALLTGSIYFWSRASGAEFGVAIAILAPALVAWLFATRYAEIRRLPNRQRTGRSKADLPQQEKSVADPRSIPRHLLLFVLTVPFSAVVATMVSVLAGTLLPWSELNEIVFAFVTMPILWGCAAYWLVADTKLLRPVLWIGLAGAIAAAILYL